MELHDGEEAPFPFIDAETDLFLRSQYSEVDFEEARKSLYTPSVQLAARCPTLRQIRWLGESVHLVRPSQDIKWRWSDELAMEKAYRVKLPLAPFPKVVAPAEPTLEENKPPRVKARRTLFASMATGAAVVGGSKSRGSQKQMGEWEDEPGDDSGYFE